MEKMITYISQLINKQVDLDTELALSSAQRARLISWCLENNIDIDTNSFKGRFRLSHLNSETVALDRSPKRMNQRSSAAAPTIGIDIQAVQEFELKQNMLNSESWESIFTKYELRYAESSQNFLETLVGIFTGKEALIKAGVQFSSYLDLEITHQENGAPIYPGYAISISHSGGFALAVAAKF
jgi:phosphopantetheinyl transferase (holo-ACP synthase)